MSHSWNGGSQRAEVSSALDADVYLVLNETSENDGFLFKGGCSPEDMISKLMLLPTGTQMQKHLLGTGGNTTRSGNT